MNLDDLLILNTAINGVTIANEHLKNNPEADISLAVENAVRILSPDYKYDVDVGTEGLFNKLFNTKKSAVKKLTNEIYNSEFMDLVNDFIPKLLKEVKSVPDDLIPTDKRAQLEEALLDYSLLKGHMNKADILESLNDLSLFGKYVANIEDSGRTAELYEGYYQIVEDTLKLMGLDFMRVRSRNTTAIASIKGSKNKVGMRIVPGYCGWFPGHFHQVKKPKGTLELLKLVTKVKPNAGDIEDWEYKSNREDYVAKFSGKLNTANLPEYNLKNDVLHGTNVSPFFMLEIRDLVDQMLIKIIEENF